MTRRIDTNNKLIKLLPGVYYHAELRDTWQMVSTSEQSLTLFGYTQSEIFLDSQLLTETIIHPDDLCIVVSKKKNSLMADTLFCVEYRIITKNGTTRYVRDQYTCYINDVETWTMEGYISEVPHSGVRDRLLLITDQKEVERQRQNYTDLLENIAWMVAHDLRGPLCSIIGVTNVLLDYNHRPEEYKKGLEYLRTSSEQLSLITLKLSQFLREHEEKNK